MKVDPLYVKGDQIFRVSREKRRERVSFCSFFFFFFLFCSKSLSLDDDDDDDDKNVMHFSSLFLPHSF